MNLGDVGSFVGGIVVGIGGAVGAAKVVLLRPVEKKVKQNKSKVEENEELAEEAYKKARSNEYTLEGDPDDPNYSGVAQDVSDMKETVEHVEEVFEEVRDEE